MTTKDYVLLAGTLAGEIAINRANPDAFRAVRGAVLGIAQVLRNDNPRFDNRRFLTACGLTADDCPMSLG